MSCLSSVSLLRMKDVKRLMGSFIKEGKIKISSFENNLRVVAASTQRLGWLCQERGHSWHGVAAQGSLG